MSSFGLVADARLSAGIIVWLNRMMLLGQRWSGVVKVQAMETSPPWHSTLYGVLPHPTEPRILLLPGPAGWSLPQRRLDERVWAPSAVQRLYEALRDDLGIAAPVLRCLLSRDDKANHEVHAVFALENDQPAWTPPAGARWIDRATLAELTLAQPEQRPALEDCLAEAAGAPVPEQRPPWARAGWFKPATAWIETEVARLGSTLVAPIEYVKTWGISAVLRARTTSGDLFFKQAARLPLFADEPRLTAALARLYPQHIPAPLAIDAARGWMLLADIGIERRDMSDIAPYEAAMRIWGELQRASTAAVEELFAAGCLDRRLDVLAAQLDPLLDDPETHAHLAAEEIAELRRLTPHLKALCRHLADYGIPPALAHGDLHWDNIALHADNAVIFDWTDGCVAHPFLDLVTLLKLPAALPEREAIKVRLRDRYLASWTDYAPLEQLQAAAALAEALGNFHQAVSYHAIVNGLEAASKHELASGLSYFLRQGLNTIRQPLAIDRLPVEPEDVP